MGILLGWLCFFCFLGLAAKGIARKAGMKRADMIFMKLHKLLSGGFLLLGGGHILAVMPVFRARAGGLYLSGVVVLLLAIVLILLCHMMHRDKGGWLRWHQVLTAAMLLGILFHIVIYWMDFQAYRRKIACIHLQEITISSLADGEYVGEYDAGYIYARVKVTIRNGRIQELSLLEHRNERGQAAEQVLADIELTQEFPADAVSGATNSSKVIQKAVENALMGGK